MKELTQEQAERCARACGWTQKPIVRLFASNPTPSWVDADGEFRQSVEMILDLDPMYWFPRLWEKYKSRPLHTNGAWPIYPGRDMVEDCLALCAAIEALEGR